MNVLYINACFAREQIHWGGTEQERHRPALSKPYWNYPMYVSAIEDDEIEYRPPRCHHFGDKYTPLGGSQCLLTNLVPEKMITFKNNKHQMVSLFFLLNDNIHV